MFYAAHTPSFLSLSPTLPFSFSSSLHLIFCPVSVSIPLAAAVSLVGQNTYRTYRLLRTAFPVILSGHRRPGRELLLTCMHVVPPPSTFYYSPVTRMSTPSMFSSAATKQVTTRSVILTSSINSSSKFKNRI